MFNVKKNITGQDSSGGGGTLPVNCEGWVFLPGCPLLLLCWGSASSQQGVRRVPQVQYATECTDFYSLMSVLILAAWWVQTDSISLMSANWF